MALGQGILSGKKTYVVAIMAILGATASYLTGEVDLVNTAQLILTAVLGMTLKSGQNDAVKKLSDK